MVLITKKQKTPPVHHRKRQGQHHKRSKDYDKHYWPFLPLMGLIGFGFLLNIMWAPVSQSFRQRDVLGYATGTSLPTLLDETNLERAGNSLSDLQINGQLNKAAQAKANDMANRNYWSHVTPDGIQPWSFVTDAGYKYQAIGENLAYGFSDSHSTISGWMNSPEHRDNLLNGKYQDVGFGIASAKNYQGKGQQTIVVALYGQADAVSVGATVRQATISQPIEMNFQVDNPATIEVTRMQTVASTVPAWSVAVVLLLTIVGVGWTIFRHGRQIHRAILNGERFILKHTAFDLTVVAVVIVGILITRSAGFIQ